MKRWVFVLALTSLELAVSLYAQTQAEPDIIDWRSRPQWNEKSLRDEATGRPIFREFLLTPFWGRALARVTVKPDGSGELVTKWLDDRESGKQIVSKTRHLAPAEVLSFLAEVKQADFWTLPKNVPLPGRRLYTDGDICTLEGIDGQSYHAVRRLIPPQTKFTSACSFFTRPALVEALRSTHSP